MKPRRVGVAGLLLATIAFPGGSGCLPSAPPTRPVVALRPTELSDSHRLGLPEEWRGPVRRMVWGGGPSSLRLGILLDDGQFAVARPDVDPDSVLVAPRGATGTAIAVGGAGVVLTGDDRGVSTWRETPTGLEADGRSDMGPVTAAEWLPDTEAEFVLGFGDGRLIRVAIDADGQIAPLAVRTAPETAAAVREIRSTERGRSLLVVRADGKTERHRADLGAPPVTLVGASLATATDERFGWTARLVEGPAVVVEAADGSGPGWSLPLPGEPSSLGFAGDEPSLLVGCERALLIIPLREDGKTAPSRIQAIEGDRWSVAAHEGGRTVAIADASGQVEVFDERSLRLRSARWSLDECPPVAFHPAFRLHRPRPNAAPLDLPEALRVRIESIRSALDRGEIDGLRGPLLTIQDEPALNRLASAEVAMMLAAVAQRTGRATETVLDHLEQASNSFALLELADREADTHLWRGAMLAPGWDGLGGRPETAIGHLDRAAALYRSTTPALERQALVCEAIKAWSLLVTGRPAAARVAFQPVERSLRSDPVLGQAAELDRIAAALAATRGDWEVARAYDRRALDRLRQGIVPRPDLERSATLALVGELAMLDDWGEAAELLHDDRPADAEWGLRRATVRARAGLPADEPGSAHARGRMLLAEAAGARLGPADSPVLRRAISELESAIRVHQATGRGDLAAEAQLERAEALERLGDHAAAVESYRQTMVHLGTREGSTAAGIATTPTRSVRDRAQRGLARTLVKLDQPEAALAALDRGWVQAHRDPSLGPSPAAPASARPRLAPDPGQPGGLIPDRIEPGMLRLASGDAAIAYAALGAESMVGFLIRPGIPIQPKLLPIRRSELSAAIESWRTRLGEGGRPPVAPPEGRLDRLISLADEPELDPNRERTLRRGSTWEAYLDDALIRPFWADLQGASRCWIVPGDVLASMPLEVIGRDQRLFRKIEVAYLPRLGLLPTLKLAKSASPSDTVLLVAAGTAENDATGDPRWADAEVLQGWAERYRKAGFAADLAMGLDSGNGAFPSSPGSSGIVHLSLRYDRPPAAGQGLVLGPDSRLFQPTSYARPRNSWDGWSWLQAPIQARVAIWALPGTEDVLEGIASSIRDRAALPIGAGTSTLILPLWEPPADSGVLLLDELHRQLAANEPPGRALRRARERVALDVRYRDPVHWAGFVLYGNP